MRKIVSIIMLLIVILDCAGCGGAWRRKFVRKKKDDTVQGPVLQPFDYRKEFTNKQLYANHYAFWRTSESELIKLLAEKGNEKKIKSNALYSLLEIRKLHNLLIEEKQQGIAPYIKELEDIISRIKEPGYINSNGNILSRQLSKHYRGVSRDFSYFKMKNYVKPDGEEVRGSDGLDVAENAQAAIEPVETPLAAEESKDGQQEYVK